MTDEIWKLPIPRPMKTTLLALDHSGADGVVEADIEALSVKTQSTKNTIRRHLSKLQEVNLIEPMESERVFRLTVEAVC